MSFSGTPLSNFYPCEVTLGSLSAPSVEHAYSAAKTNDKAAGLATLYAPTAGQARKIGRTLTLRKDWESIKLRVMRDLLAQKFAVGTECAEYLKNYYGSLTEVNHWHDNFWGDCTCSRCFSFAGENVLGRMLNVLRVNLQEDSVFYYVHHESSCLWVSPREETLYDLVEPLSSARYLELSLEGYAI